MEENEFGKTDGSKEHFWHPRYIKIPTPGQKSVFSKSNNVTKTKFSGSNFEARIQPVVM